MMKTDTDTRLYIRWLIVIVIVALTGGFSQSLGQQNQENELLTNHYQVIKSFYDIPASIQVKDASLPEVFSLLEEQMGLRFLYNLELIEQSRHRLNLEFSEATVADVLKEVGSQTGLTFRQINRIVSVGADKLREPAPSAEETAFFEIVTGRVTDAQTREPLPGVNVIVQGTSSGTATDSDGNFELEVSSLDETLVFTYVGYQTLEIPLEGQTEVNAELSAETVTGDELVVVGYGVQRRSEITGSVGVVTADELTPTSFNALQGLRGKVAGVIFLPIRVPHLAATG